MNIFVLTLSNGRRSSALRHMGPILKNLVCSSEIGAGYCPVNGTVRGVGMWPKIPVKRTFLLKHCNFNQLNSFIATIEKSWHTNWPSNVRSYAKSAGCRCLSTSFSTWRAANDSGKIVGIVRPTMNVVGTFPPHAQLRHIGQTNGNCSSFS